MIIGIGYTTVVARRIGTAGMDACLHLSRPQTVGTITCRRRLLVGRCGYTSLKKSGFLEPVVNNESEVVPQDSNVNLQDLPELLEQSVVRNAFELTKQQSFWLLNLVAFLYGTNTTYAPISWYLEICLLCTTSLITRMLRTWTVFPAREI